MLSKSSVSRRQTRPSWLSTTSPLASVSSGISGVSRWKWRCSVRMPVMSPSARVSGVTSAGVASNATPTGLCSSIVAGSVAASWASGSISTSWVVIIACGSSTTTPSTVTQPPSMYCSASAREQRASSATCLDRRIGSGGEGVMAGKTREQGCTV